FRNSVISGQADRLREILARHPFLRDRINDTLFDLDAPAIVASRKNRAMVDALLDSGADINARSQFWGRTVGVLDDNDNPQMVSYLIERGAIPQMTDFVEAVKNKDAARVKALLEEQPAL